MNLQVLVVGENVAEQMATYDGNREGPFNAQVSKEEIQRMYEDYGVRPGDQQGLQDTLRKKLGWKATFEEANLLLEMNVNPRAR